MEYSRDAICGIPDKVILKTASKEKEYFFYTQIAEWMENIPVPNCYPAQQSEDKSQAIFLLEDISDTHSQTKWPISPSLEHCEMAIDSLSTFHAFWWNDSRLETEFREKVTKGNYWTGRLNKATVSFLLSSISSVTDCLQSLWEFMKKFSPHPTVIGCPIAQEKKKHSSTVTSTFGIIYFQMNCQKIKPEFSIGIHGISGKGPMTSLTW